MEVMLQFPKNSKIDTLKLIENIQSSSNKIRELTIIYCLQWSFTTFERPGTDFFWLLLSKRTGSLWQIMRVKMSLILSLKLNLRDKRSRYLRINLLLDSSPSSDHISNPNPLFKVEIMSDRVPIPCEGPPWKSVQDQEVKFATNY